MNASRRSKCIEDDADSRMQGMEYNQRYAWVCRFNEKAIIVEVRAYLDSALVNKAIDQNS